MSLDAFAAACAGPSYAPISRGGYGGKLRLSEKILRCVSGRWLLPNEDE
jgi:hypothetical protein